MAPAPTPGINNNSSDYAVNGKRVVHDVYRTNYGTKLFVENGVLIEEPIQGSLPQIQVSLPQIESPYDDDDNMPQSPIIPPDSPPTAEDLLGMHAQNVKTAEAALIYYNKKHAKNYVLVDPIRSGGFIGSDALYYHCNFTAKHESSSTRLFFAEIEIINKGQKLHVTACRPIDDGKTTTECEYCLSGIMLHPTRGFRQGLHKYEDRTLRPRRRVMKKT